MKMNTMIAKLFYDLRHRNLPRLGTDNPLSRASDGQDIYVAKTLPNNEASRIFVEIGGNDGVTLSNTHYLESEKGWQGISVEPLSCAYDKLAKNRNCVTVNACITEYDGETSFYAISGVPEMLSGIFDKYDERHKRRVRRNLKRHKATAEEITVPCYRLDTILKEHKITHVDYLSIDTEGGELDILKSIDLNAVPIEMISVENNYFTYDIEEYMANRGYCMLCIAGRDEFYRKG